VSTFEFVYNII